MSTQKAEAEKTIQAARALLESDPTVSPAVRAAFDLLINLYLRQAERIDQLEAQLAKNSRNSSKPPGSEGLKKPPQTKSNRKPSGKTSGGQPGHKGASLSQVEKPDVIVTHPVNSCRECGLSLASMVVDALEKRQVFDLPPLNLIVTEHQAEQKTCSCGYVTTGTFPTEAAAPVQYGPWVQALVVYLSTYQFIPYGRLKEFFSELFSVNMSPATMKRIMAVAADKTSPVVEKIKTSIINSALAHFDETGMRVEDQKSRSRIDWRVRFIKF